MFRSVRLQLFKVYVFSPQRAMSNSEPASGPKSSMCWRVMYEIPVVKSRLRVMVRIKNNVCSQKIVSIKSAKKIYTEL